MKEGTVLVDSDIAEVLDEERAPKKQHFGGVRDDMGTESDYVKTVMRSVDASES